MSFTLGCRDRSEVKNNVFSSRGPEFNFLAYFLFSQNWLHVFYHPHWALHVLGVEFPESWAPWLDRLDRRNPKWIDISLTRAWNRLLVTYFVQLMANLLARRSARSSLSEQIWSLCCKERVFTDTVFPHTAH